MPKISHTSVFYVVESESGSENNPATGTPVWSELTDDWTSILFLHQGAFLCCQALWPARHQTYSGGQTCQQEADEEGPGDSGT